MIKKLSLIICSAAVLLFSCNNEGKENTQTASIPEVKNESPAVTPLDSATKIKNWQNYMTPGDMHKMIASWNGTWTAEISIWEKAGAEPFKSPGTSVNRMIMGGRYQESNHTSIMMGMPFEGRSTLGYDNARKVFESTWVDNFGTGIMKMSGAWDSTNNMISFTGKGIDPVSGTENDYRETFNIIDDNAQLMSMYGPGQDGKEFKMMEIKFTRKK